jgi:hypothetical protein
MIRQGRGLRLTGSGGVHHGPFGIKGLFLNEPLGTFLGQETGGRWTRSAIMRRVLPR